MPPRPVLASILYAALHSPTGGVWVRTPDPFRTRHLLYQHRAKIRDPALLRLRIHTPVPPYSMANELWIVNPPKDED